MIMTFQEPPANFNPKIEAAGCYVEREGKVLFLQYAKTHPFEPNTWGVPGGKLEPGETPEEAAVRELFEETTLTCKNPVYLGPCFISKPGVIDYVFHLFQVTEAEGEPQIGHEHQGWRWVFPNELSGLGLMAGAHETFEIYRLNSSVGRAAHS